MINVVLSQWVVQVSVPSFSPERTQLPNMVVLWYHMSPEGPTTNRIICTYHLGTRRLILGQVLCFA